ncbi:TPA: hypothetical protein I8372_004258 [Citrobacter farmeri]|nr:hypothetical protein [Citrobacter farmeri]HAT2779049.1 hypothetical protein [Citrobacter farmeri]HAT2810055.1 hypothetical protein [Citrobacter farmeri]HBC0549871.1 hypothetical protein [Citrobacter farmeri]
MEAPIKNTTKHHAFDINLIDEIGPWLEEMGIKYNATRFGASTKIYKKWFEGSHTPTFHELWGICELIDLMEFYNSFHSSDEDIKNLFHSIKAGSTTLEKSQNCSARDYAFELKIASRFKRAGFKIINDNSHDVVVEKGKIKLYCECKRPRKEETIIERIRYAYDNQFKDIENKSEQAVICIDLSNVLYNIFTKEFEKRGSEDILTDLETLAKYRDSTDRYFKHFLESKATEVAHGVRMVILYYSFPTFIEDPIESEKARFTKFNHFTRITNYVDETDSIISESLVNSAGVQLDDGV